MGVRRPAWWCYPERCQNGHEWGPGLITVSWVLCDCPAARAASGGGAAGHMAVFCNAAPGCRPGVVAVRARAWARLDEEPDPQRRDAAGLRDAPLLAPAFARDGPW